MSVLSSELDPHTPSPEGECVSPLEPKERGVGNAPLWAGERGGGPSRTIGQKAWHFVSLCNGPNPVLKTQAFKLPSSYLGLIFP